MLARKCLILVLLAATQLQPINSLNLLPTTQTQTIDHMFPNSIKGNMESMLDPVDLEWLQQAIAKYKKPTKPTVRFFLYCKRNNRTESYELFTEDMVGLNKTCFVKNACVKILVHAWLQTYKTPCVFPQSTKDAYPEATNCPNVIIVDYSRTTGYYVYPLAVALGLREARDQGAAFIRWLILSGATLFDFIHVLGFSLGGQVAAAICAQVYATMGKKIRRLTVLDPAGPCFYPNLCHAAHVVSSEDADFVDAYYTNSGGYAIIISVGHVNFCINGGRYQYFCFEPLCSHLTAPYFFEILYEEDLRVRPYVFAIIIRFCGTQYDMLWESNQLWRVY